MVHIDKLENRTNEHQIIHIKETIMKRLIMTACAAALAAGMTMTSYAGSWQGSNEAGWWWQEDNGEYPRNGWSWIDADGDGLARSYYFNADGWCQMGPGTTPDGYSIDESGAWVQDGALMEKNLSTGEVYPVGNAAGPASAGAVSAGPSGTQASGQGQDVHYVAQSTNIYDHAGVYKPVMQTYRGLDMALEGSLSIDGTHIVCDAGGEKPIVFDVQNPGIYDPNSGTHMTMWNANDGSPFVLVVSRAENPADSGEGATMYCVYVSILEGGSWSLFFSNDL